MSGRGQAPRKPMGREVRAVRLPSPVVRQQIWDAAVGLLGSERLISVTLARRFQLSPEAVESVILREGMRHERTAAALHTGILSALQMAREVRDDAGRLAA